MKIYILFFALFVFYLNPVFSQNKEFNKIKSYLESKEFQYENISGIGFEKGVTRRDNSDILKVDGKYYVYYTKVMGQSAGYWGTIWVAVSDDDGRNWRELGEVLGTGKKGEWDSQAVFTPSVIEVKGVYYLYYTGVQPTPGNVTGDFENNSVNDFTAIGVAKSTSPVGPFVRCLQNPVLSVSSNKNEFDSYRIDDALLFKKENRFWLYYKGRKYTDGKSGPVHTKMGVAFSDNPEGVFIKYKKNPVLAESHEVFVWRQNSGVACLASISCTFEYAADWLNFTTNPLAVQVERKNRPNAPGAFRPDLTNVPRENRLTWGISMIHNGDNSYLVRWKLVDK